MKKIYSIFIARLTLIYDKTFRKGQININNQPDNTLFINPKGIQTNYTTQDILQVARLFDGETIAYPTNAFLTSNELESFYEEVNFSNIEDLSVGGVKGKTRIVIKQDGTIKMTNLTSNINLENNIVTINSQTIESVSTQHKITSPVVDITANTQINIVSPSIIWNGVTITCIGNKILINGKEIAVVGATTNGSQIITNSGQ
jgi:hypothetical protein